MNEAPGSENFKDIALRIIDAARRAPSSHNSQPWLFRIRGNTLELHGNPARRLTASDKSNRELFLSLGCALENLCIAAAHYRYSPSVTLFPDHSAPWFVALVKLSPGGREVPENAARFLAISRRHSNRSEFGRTPVPPDTATYFRSLGADAVKIFIIEDEAARQVLARAVADATEAAFKDAGFKKELSHWIKPSLKKYRDGMPGYNIGIPWPVSFIVPFAIRHFKVARAQRKMVEKALKASPAYAILTSRSDTPAAWIEAGRIFERLWLEATAMGLNLGPLAAAIEIGEYYKKIQETLKTSDRPVFFSRLGYSSKVPQPAPRLSREEVLVTG